jgi:hypothetical protein
MSTTVDETTTTQAPASEEQEAGTQPDRSQYDKPGLRLAKIDGKSVDRIAIKFSGQVMLDRSDPADVKLFRDLELGKQNVSLLIEAAVDKASGSGATNRDGDLDVIVGSKTLRIHSLMRPASDDAPLEAD